MTITNASTPPSSAGDPAADLAGTKTGVVASVMNGLPTLLVLAVMGGGWIVMHQINSGDSSTEEMEEPAPATTSSDTLTLPEGKLRVAEIESVTAQAHNIQHVHTVPGRLRYDQTKHVDVKAPMDGILAELVVTPGDQVNAGDLIAVLRSPEIGQARAEILKRQKERDIAEQILQRELTLAKNLQQVSDMLDQGQSVDAIEKAFSNRALGAYRQDILSAYSKMLLADEQLAKLRPLVASGSVSGRTVRDREGERQLAETAFRTARDQASFEIEQSKMKAEANLAEAERQFNLAWQSLETLLGYKEDKDAVNLSNEEALSRLEVRAPFGGSVESRGYANNERVMRGDSLAVLANTESLSVEASIRESDWSVVNLHPGAEVSVMVPALDQCVFPAKVLYFGREVQADTNSVPLVARIENNDGLLRPGMFVRVTVPIGERRQALSIKPESILRHENKPFVFVDLGNGSFQRVDVSTGQTSEDWVEVTKGLSAGQPVVTQGAFLLKSELLLQGEGE
ncbi:MAG: efflux RND transporter periplasmic adaptor subunit [Rhodopirellula sp. JB055]|uniref:efflux RND transporter periplasmic adaptor subunit n=1 Tax=Rhodopirellula sp. JB055 TaxID=3342846 RepID=UPI00370B9541